MRKLKLKQRFIFQVLCVAILIYSFIDMNQAIYAQKFVQDSLKISFTENDYFKLENIRIDSVIDNRDEHPQVLARSEKKKYLYIPIDLLILTEKSLSDEILNMVKSTGSHTKYNLAIDEFHLSKVSSNLYPRYQLNTSVTLYKKNDKNKAEYIGQLLYESKYRKPFWGDKLKTGLESVISKWQYELIDDLSLINENDTGQLNKLYNFRTSEYHGKNSNLITAFDVSLGTFGQIIDLQLFFSNREAQKWIFRSGGYNMRYRNNDEFEAIEFGFTNDYLFYRLHKNYMVRSRMNMFFGLNRWKDLNKVDHKVYDAFILDYSLSQSFIYNPLDKRSLLLGIGLLENLTYVYSKDLQFEIGVLLQLGIKL